MWLRRVETLRKERLKKWPTKPLRAIFHEKREGKGDQEARQRDSREVRATGSAMVKLEISNRRRTTA
jgi:hypothetical protein